MSGIYTYPSYVKVNTFLKGLILFVCSFVFACSPTPSIAESNQPSIEKKNETLASIFKRIKADVEAYAAKNNGEIPLWDDEIVEMENLDELVADGFWEDVRNTVFERGQPNEYARMILDISPNSAKILSEGNFKGRGFDDVIAYFDGAAEIERLDKSIQQLALERQQLALERQQLALERQESEQREQRLKKIADMANSIANK